MLRSLRKAVQSLEKGMETAFSTPSPSLTAYTNTILTISSIKLRLGPVFAEGGYSFIHSATPVSPSQKYVRYAVKRLACADADSRQQAQHEIDLLNSLPAHPNIVHFFGATFHHHHAFLLFELVDGGTLPETLADSTPNASRLLDIFADAVSAVAHLHAQQPPIAARDVKLENILFDRLQHCYKLCDFGSATTQTYHLSSRREILTVEEDIAGNCTAMYRAPELVDLYSRRFICEKVDVWALGCVWHGLLYGTLPFEGVSALQIAKGLRQVPTEPLYPPLYVPLLESMLTVDPALRPDIFQVLQAVSYMQGVQMQPDMQRAGVRLRELRAKDFGGVIGGFGERAELFGFEQAKLGAVSTRNDANMISTIASVPRQRPCVSMPDKDWTDFESAFCEISADAFSSKTISVGAVQDGKKVGRPSEKIGACVKQKTSVCPMGSSTGTASMALIDFSDMTDRRDKEQVERKKDGNGGGKFKDLIDFESNAFG